MSKLILVLLIGGMVMMIRPEAGTNSASGPTPEAMNRISPAAGRVTSRRLTPRRLAPRRKTRQRHRLRKRRYTTRQKARHRRKRRR